MSSDYRQIGVVTRPHGLKGEVKVRPDTDDPDRFGSLEHVLLGDTGADATRFEITGVRYQTMRSGTAVILSLDGISTRESAERIAGMSVWVDQTALPPLDEDEVYLSDLIGLELWDAAGRCAGSVADVLDLPAQPVLVVRRESGDDILVPFVHDLVESVDDRRIVVHPLEGLLDPDGQEEVA